MPSAPSFTVPAGVDARSVPAPSRLAVELAGKPITRLGFVRLPRHYLLGTNPHRRLA